MRRSPEAARFSLDAMLIEARRAAPHADEDMLRRQIEDMHRMLCRLDAMLCRLDEPITTEE